MEREIRSCITEDGILIAYSVTGDGPPLLVCHEGLESFTLDHLITGQENFFDELGRGRRLIRYDPRGVGLSQRDVEDYSLEAAMRDLHAVVRATGFERVSIFAPCTGSWDAMAFAALHPARVERLVVYSASVGFPRAAIRWGETMAQLWRTMPRVAKQTYADSVDRGAYPELCTQLATMFGQSVNGGDAATRIEQTLPYDVTDFLPRIQAPTLVIHRRGDRGNPVASAQGVAARISAAKLAILDGDAHWYTMDPGAILAAIAAFLPAALSTAAAAPQASFGTRTILFTDIVGHTEMMQRLGDAKGRDVLREHERITRETLKQHGGAEVKTMGDGFMASFGSVTQAMECAVSLQRAFSGRGATMDDGGWTMEEPLSIRIGLNAGEPIEEDGDLFGATVILASRIAAKAAGGEILIPEPVRHLLSGKAFIFSDRGEHAMKGFDDAVRLYEVRWRE